jgi:hypothetical protein
LIISTFVENLNDMKTEPVKEKVKTNREYLMFIADRIASERPSAEIIYNTLVGIDERGVGRGYKMRIADGRKFKEKQLQRRTESFNAIKDNMDNLTHKGETNNENDNNE